jgi:2-haloacid dehalogenase
MQSLPTHAIIFDFGGVLIKWDPRKLFLKYFADDKQGIEKFLAEINFFEWNLLQDKGYPFSMAVKDLSAQFPQYSHLIHAYDKDWEESITGIIPGTAEILIELKKAGCRLYGLTNWSAEKFSIVRKKYKIFNLFDDIVVSGEVKLIKPDPAIFRLLLKNIQLQPQECLLVDDSIPNIETAKMMGFVTHHFTSSVRLALDLQKLGIL